MKNFVFAVLDDIGARLILIGIGLLIIVGGAILPERTMNGLYSIGKGK